MIREAEKSKICSWQDGDPGQLMVQFQSKSEGLITRRDDV